MMIIVMASNININSNDNVMCVILMKSINESYSIINNDILLMIIIMCNV